MDIMAIKINPVTPALPLPLNPLGPIIRENRTKALDTGKIVNAKDIGPGKLGVKNAENFNGLRKTLVDKYI
jgi:hypothetical protein